MKRTYSKPYVLEVYRHMPYRKKKISKKYRKEKMKFLKMSLSTYLYALPFALNESPFHQLVVFDIVYEKCSQLLVAAYAAVVDVERQRRESLARERRCVA